MVGHAPTIVLYEHAISPSPGGILSSEHVERRLVAMLAADVAGSCRVIGGDEKGALAQLKALRMTLLDPKKNDRRGRIIKRTGTALALSSGAARCATEILARHGRTKYQCAAGQGHRISHRQCRAPLNLQRVRDKTYNLVNGGLLCVESCCSQSF
jgi:class 3 adenylate cyclase